MAALSSPFWRVITPEMRQVLFDISQQSFSHDFYLAGGTALSLQIGHRQSVDLDFFSETDEVGEHTRNEIVRSLKPFSVEVIENVGGNLVILVNNIRVGFFSYGYPLVDRYFAIDNLLLASLADIGLMKCDALISRGSRKDFIDLFFIARSIPFEKLFQLSAKKYLSFRDFPLMVLERMTLFQRAEREIQPELFEAISWQQVKDFYFLQAANLSRDWFDVS